MQVNGESYIKVCIFHTKVPTICRCFYRLSYHMDNNKLLRARRDKKGLFQRIVLFMAFMYIIDAEHFMKHLLLGKYEVAAKPL